MSKLEIIKSIHSTSEVKLSTLKNGECFKHLGEIYVVADCPEEYYEDEKVMVFNFRKCEVLGLHESVEVEHTSVRVSL